MMKRLFLTALAAALSFFAVAQTDDDDNTTRRGSEWRDPETFEQNRLAPRANVVPYDDENGIEKWAYYQSSSYLPLDGEWRADYSDDYIDRASEIESRTLNTSGWQVVEWPDVRWLKEGRALRRPAVGAGASLAEKGNATALFYNEFDVPREWGDYYVFLQLQPLSACYVWVNGAYVGYMENGRTLGEFDISSFLQLGKRNDITLQMVSLSTSSLLEMNREPHYLGMASEPAICLKRDVNVQDYTLRAAYDNGKGRLSIDFNVVNRNRKGRYYLEVELWGPQGRQVEKMGKWFAFDKRSETLVAIEREINAVEPWSAEKPNLYTAVMRLLDEKMNTIETVGTRFGFRTIELAGGQMLVNGRAVTLRGMLYGDYSADADGVVDYDVVEEDLKLMKRLNVNAIRTAVHSPASPRFYELCDLYGFYVVCDANINPYSSQSKAIATDNAYSELFVGRMRDMYGQLKNHSCIIAWSLGDGKDNGTCMTAAYKHMKMLDRERLVLCSAAGYGENTDAIACGQATDDDVRQYLGRVQSRPLIFMSFGSAEGNSMGGLDDLWRMVDNNARLQGGFFAAWSDVKSLDIASGSPRVIHGVKRSDGKLAPGSAELSAIYRPFDVALRSFSADAGEFSITNRQSFVDGRDYIMEYKIYTSLKPSIISGEVPALPEAGSVKDFKLMVPKLRLYAGEEMFISFTLRQRHAFGGAEKDAVLYAVDFPIAMETVAKQPFTPEMCQPIWVEERRANDTAKTLQRITVKGDFGEAAIDMQKGEITSYRFRGKELLQSPVSLNFWRLPTDNDRSEYSVARQWNALRPGQVKRQVTEITYSKRDDYSVVVDAMLRYSSPSGSTLMDVRQTILVLCSGDIVISSDIMATDVVKSFPRVGLQMQVSKELTHAEWMGADVECYADRMDGVRLGRHKSDAAELYSRYERPQEAGSRADTRWLSLNNGTVGLFVDMPESRFSFSLYPYSDESLAKASSYAAAGSAKGMTLNVDCRMAGIGSALAGLDLPERTVVADRKIHFVAHLAAYSLAEYEPFDFCRMAYPKASSTVLEMPVISRDRDRFDGPLTIVMSAPDTGAAIRYTLDGSDPTEQSPLYEAPFKIENTTMIKARAFRQGDAPSFTAQMRCDFAYIVAVAYDAKPNTPYNHNAAYALFDGEEGDISDLSQGWIGFSGGDFGATLQLSKPLDVDEVALRFAHNPEAWIFAPKEVWVRLSYNGADFVDSVKAKITYDPAQQSLSRPAVFSLVVPVERNGVKAVRVEARGIGRIPEWHRAKGLKPWVMTDEITVKERIR